MDSLAIRCSHKAEDKKGLHIPKPQSSRGREKSEAGSETTLISHFPRLCSTYNDSVQGPRAETREQEDGWSPTSCARPILLTFTAMLCKSHFISDIFCPEGREPRQAAVKTGSDARLTLKYHFCACVVLPDHDDASEHGGGGHLSYEEEGARDVAGDKCAAVVV